MRLNLLTRAAVKAQLGISTTTHDAQIDAMLPIVSSDVRRILNNQFNTYFTATVESGSTRLVVGEPSAVSLGQVVNCSAITEGTYITAYDYITGYYTLSAAAIGSLNYVNPSILIGQIPTISKMVWYKITGMNTDSAGAEKLASVSYGPVSKTFAPSEINAKWNYPQTLIDDLGEPFSQVG